MPHSNALCHVRSFFQSLPRPNIERFKDLIKPTGDSLHPKCKFIQGNITELKSLEHAFENSKCKLGSFCDLWVIYNLDIWFKTVQVFHTASAGLTGPGQLNKELCYSVNLDGTRWEKVLNQDSFQVQKCDWDVFKIQYYTSSLYIIVQCYIFEQILRKYRRIRTLSWWQGPIWLLLEIKESRWITFIWVRWNSTWLVPWSTIGDYDSKW